MHTGIKIIMFEKPYMGETNPFWGRGETWLMGHQLGLTAALRSELEIQADYRCLGCALLSHIHLVHWGDKNCYDLPLPTIDNWKHPTFQSCCPACRTGSRDLDLLTGLPGKGES